MSKKQEKGKIFTRIMAGVLAGIMVLAGCASLIYAIVA